MDGRSDLTELAAALRDLHRCLVERMRREHEQECRAVVSAAQFLPLLTSDARFAWLHVLSELIVDVEVFLRADPAPAEDDCAALRAELERLLIAARFPESASAFARAYARYVAQDERIADAHALVARLAALLPRAGAVDEGGVLHERHRWSEAYRHRRPAGL